MTLHSHPQTPTWLSLLRRLRRSPGVLLLVLLSLAIVSYRKLSPSTSTKYADALSPRWQRATASWRASRLPRVVFYTVPKPFVGLADKQQRRALYSWTHLTGVAGAVKLVPSQDSNAEELATMAQAIGATIADVRWDPYGAVLQDELFVTASRETDADLVVVLNSDIVLFDDFSRTIARALEEFTDNFFLVSARYEIPEPDDGAELASFESPEYFKQLFRNRSTTSVLQSYGGVDLYVWRPGGDPYARAVGGTVPPFTFGRGKADNWVLRQAQLNGVPTIDASLSIKSLHFTHGYGGSATAVQVDENGQVKFVDHWHSATGPSVDLNRFSFFEFGSVELQRGTPWETQWKIMLCSRMGGDELCMQERVGEWCPCEYNPLMKTTISPIRIIGEYKVCANLSPPEGFRRPTETEGALLTAQWRARDGVLILLGLDSANYDLVDHAVCRFHQLNVDNFVIVAFDLAALRRCRKASYPCVAGFELSETSVSAPDAKQLGQPTVAKERQILRFMEAGYNVIWSDVQSFWIKDVQYVLKDPQYAAYDFMVTGDQGPTARAELSANSVLKGVFFARNSSKSINLLQALIEHSTSAKGSGRSSLYTVLCHDRRKESAGATTCQNKEHQVSSYFLPPDVFHSSDLAMWNSMSWPQQVPKSIAILQHPPGSGSGHMEAMFQKSGLDLYKPGRGCTGFP